MKVLILMASPRLRGNTAELCKPFLQELEEKGAEAGEKQSGLNAQRQTVTLHQNGNKNRCAECNK